MKINQVVEFPIFYKTIIEDKYGNKRLMENVSMFRGKIKKIFQNENKVWIEYNRILYPVKKEMIKE